MSKGRHNFLTLPFSLIVRESGPLSNTMRTEPRSVQLFFTTYTGEIR